MSTPTAMPPTPQATVTVTQSPAPVPSLGGVPVSGLTLAVALLAAFAALYGAYLQRRTGRDTIDVDRQTALGVAQRAEADALAKRYQESAAQLGHEKAPVRLAGVYAMVRLADDWYQHRQECVDVLCSYLRMQPSDQPGEEEVRRAVTTQIAARLQSGAPKPWSDLPIDLSGAHLSQVDFTNAVFGERADFSGASFDGDCSFERTKFREGTDFSQSRVLEGGILRFLTVDFGANTSFDGFECQPGSKLALMQNKGRRVDFREARIYGDLAILLMPANEGEFYDLSRTELREAGKVEVVPILSRQMSTMPAGETRVRLESVRVEDSGSVDVPQSLINSRIVHWGITSKASAESLTFTPPSGPPYHLGPDPRS